MTLNDQFNNYLKQRKALNIFPVIYWVIAVIIGVSSIISITDTVSQNDRVAVAFYTCNAPIVITVFDVSSKKKYRKLLLCIKQEDVKDDYDILQNYYGGYQK